jgi:hypothetical protein
MSAATGTAFRTVAFGDVEGQLWGAAVASDGAHPAGLVVGGAASAVVAEPRWAVEERSWVLSGDGFELHVEPRGEDPTEDDGTDDGGGPQVSGLQELCRVHGRISLPGGEHTVDCGGARSEIDGLEPDAIASARIVTGWFVDDEALTLIALRSRRASDQESDLIAATLFDHEGWVPVSDPRLSTTYTQSGDPARMSLELWVADGENEFPRRAAGEATGAPVVMTAGELELRVAPLRCHSRGLEGSGVYVLASL